MSELVWDEAWSIGIPKFDGHHRRQMELINEYVKALDAGKSNQELIPMLMALIEYTKMHFNSEDAFFSKVGYPKAESHRKEHDYLSKQLLEYHLKIKHNQDVDSSAVMNYLKEWLIKHINGPDREYSTFASTKSAV